MAELPHGFPPMGPLPPLHPPQMLPSGLQHPSIPLPQSVPNPPLQFQHTATPPISLPPFPPQPQSAVPMMPMPVPYMSGQPMIPVSIPLQMEQVPNRDAKEKKIKKLDRKIPSPEIEESRPIKRLRKKQKKKCPWSEHKAPDGRMYYYNSDTKESVWQKPEDLLLPAERLLRQLPWKEHKSDSGRSYFYNSETKKSTWDIPPELERVKAVVEAEREHNMTGWVVIHSPSMESICVTLFGGFYSRYLNCALLTLTVL